MVSDAEQQSVDGFQLVNLIAQGNNSDVWEVRDPAGGQYAMKLLKSDMMTDKAQIQTLKHEARVSKALDHPNFVKFHKSVFNKQHAYLLMEYFRAPNVKTQIMIDRAGLHMRFRKLVEHVCLVLQFMHDKGWIHRDIKPDNILINKASELKLIDFSLSTRAGGGLAALLGGKSRVIQGTRTYIAPETIRRKAATIQTDMYSLGVTLFEILTGRPPFKAPTPDELLKAHLQQRAPAPSDYHPNVSPEMDRLVLRMLEKKPEKRPKTMNEVYAEFRALKPFVEDPQELSDREDADRRTRELDGLRSADSVLNSRADADRQAAGITAPKRKGKAHKVQAAEVFRDGQVAAQAPAAPAAAQPMAPPPPPPGPYPYPPPQLPPGPMPVFQQPPMGWPQPAWPQQPYPGYGGPPPGYPAGPGPFPPPGAPPPPPPQPGAPPPQPAAPQPPVNTPPPAVEPPRAAPAPAGTTSRPAAPSAAPRKTDVSPPAEPEGTGLVLTFAPAPAGGGAAKPATDRAAQPAAGSNGTKDQKPRSAAPPAPREPAKQEPPQEDDLPLMEELPEVI